MAVKKRKTSVLPLSDENFIMIMIHQSQDLSLLK